MRKHVNFKGVKGHLPKDDKHGKQDKTWVKGKWVIFIQKGFLQSSISTSIDIGIRSSKNIQYISYNDNLV